MKSVNLYKIALLSILCFPLSNVYSSRTCQDFQTTLNISNQTTYRAKCFPKEHSNLRIRQKTLYPFVVDAGQQGSVKHGFMVAAYNTQEGRPYIKYHCTLVKNGNGFSFYIKIFAYAFGGDIAHPCNFEPKGTLTNFQLLGTGFGGKNLYRSMTRNQGDYDLTLEEKS